MKQFWKRCLSLLLALVLFAGMLPAITPQVSAATKIVPQSAVDDLVETAKSVEGKSFDYLVEKKMPSTYPDAWCGNFVGWCFRNSKITEELGSIPWSRTHQCPDPALWAHEKGAGCFNVLATGDVVKDYKDTYYNKWVKWSQTTKNIKKVDKYTPKAGDIVFFDWEKNYGAYEVGKYYDHVGIMISKDEYIDGNSGGTTVKVHSFSDEPYRKDCVIGYFSFYTCAHSQRDNLGKCTSCGNAFELTHNYNDAGIYKLSPNLPWFVAMRKTPYAAAEKVKDINPFAKVTVYYSAKNGDGGNAEMWMYATYDKVSGWINSNDLDLNSKEALKSEITFSGMKNPGKWPEDTGWPVVGSITSRYPLTRVEGWIYNVNNTDKAEQHAGGDLEEKKTTFNIKESSVNDNLKFGELDPGNYYYVITATDSKGVSVTWPDDISKSTFQIGNPTQSTCAKPVIGAPEDVTAGKQVTITCATSGATIHWTCDGKEGTGTSPVTLPVKNSTTVKAWATKSGMKTSGTASKPVQVSRCSAPTIVVGNMTSAGRQVSVKGSNGQDVFYSYDGKSFVKFTSTLYLTGTATIYAKATKKGYQDSSVVNQQVTLSSPARPNVRLVGTAQNIACNRPITVMWDKDSDATAYYVEIYRDNAVIGSGNVSVNSYTFSTNAAGTYQVRVTAKNVAGSSEAAVSAQVKAHAPLTVQFVHEDGTLLSSQTVDYGESAISPDSVPTKEGHTFIGWDKNLGNVTQNMTVSPKFKINTYTVRFYACNGQTLLGTQQITYGSAIDSAQMEQNLTLSTGYKFAGWHIRNAASSSRMDLDFIDCDMTLVATQQWEIEDLPVVVKVTGAERNANSTGYNVDLALTCAPASVIGGDTKKIKIIVALKTDNQTLAVAVDTVDLTQDTQNLTRSIFVSYNGSGLAEAVSVTVLGVDSNDRTGGQLAKTVYATPKIGKNWSGWSTSKPPAGVEYETKTQYRYRDSDRSTTTRENKSTVAPALSGWTNLPGLRTSRWDSWSGWSDSSVTSYSDRQIETKQVQTAAAYTMYQYGRWTNGSYGCFCKYAGRDFYGGSLSSWKQEHTGWSKTRYTKVSGYYACSGYSSNDGHVNKFVDKDGVDSWYGYIPVGSSDKNANRYYWEKTETVPATYKTQYRYRDTIYTHYYEKWTTGNWSDWSDTVYSPYTQTNSKRAVETRTMYRYVTNDTTVTPIENPTQRYAFEGVLAGENVGDLSGKLATVLIYKQVNSDPTELQMEAVGQIEIGAGNSYSFAVRPKEDPSLLTGDFIVTLAVQGSSNVINIGRIPAPAEKFTVTFCDHDGTELDTQVVEDGKAAVAPEIPVREGYRFVCWSDDLTYVDRDMTIFPVQVPEEYSVVFVDHENETVELVTDYVYGDALLVPEAPSCEGMTFAGWQVTHSSTGETKMVTDESINVTDDLIVIAVWRPVEYTVTFYDHDGSVLQEQKVEHGNAAQLPEEITAPEGMVFMGWSTETSWWSVTEDLSVMPVVVYELTTAAPASDEFVYYGMMENIELEAEDGAVIYYTLDGADPEPGKENTFVYTEPFRVEEDTCVRTMAVQDNKNVSEIVEYSFWYMDDAEAYPIDDTVLVGSYDVEVDPGDTVQLQVNIQNNPGLIAYMFCIDADTNVFGVPTDVETGETECFVGDVCGNGDLIVTEYEDDIGWPVLWHGEEAVNGNGTLCNIVLQVSEDVEAGAYPITVSFSPSHTYDEEYVSQDLAGVSVDVIKTGTAQCEHTETEEEITYESKGENTHTKTMVTVCADENCGEELSREEVQENCVDKDGNLVCDLCETQMQQPEEELIASGHCGIDGGTNLVWTLNQDGVLTISGTGAMENYAKDTAPWCAHAGSLNKLVLEDGVASVGKYAFYGCSGLTGDLIFPDSVKEIGGFAFQNCTGFNGVLDLGSVETIGNYAFHTCSGLTGDLLIPETVTSIGTYTFNGCKGFDGELTLSSKLTKIGTYAFYLCKGLTDELKIPESVTTIGAYAFYRCENMTGTLTIPSKVKTIGGYAFRNCAGFDSIVLGNAVTSIGNKSFEGVAAENGVRFMGNAPTVVAADNTNRSFDADAQLYYTEGTTGWTTNGVWNGYALQMWEGTPEIVKFNIAGSNMTLGNELEVNFMAKKEDLTKTGCTAVITQTLADGTTRVTEVAQAEWKTMGVYHKISARIAAREMADQLAIEIFDADGNVLNEAYSTSVRGYAGRALAADTTTEYVRILMVDMLNYGAAAQNHFKYNVEDLANNELTEEQQADATEKVTCANNQVKDTTVYGANLSLEDSILLNTFFKGLKGKDIASMYAIVTFTDFEGKAKEVRMEGTEFEKYGTSGDIYKIVVDDVVLADAKQMVTVTLYNADGTVFGVNIDSVESYVARAEQNNADTYGLYANIMKFATSAYNYIINK